MANLAITNTFATLTTISSSQVNQNFTDIKTWLNNRDNATDFWLNMKVNTTGSNPAEIKSSAITCEFDIDCTGASGVPFISWRRSGTSYFSMGVDGGASNIFKMGLATPTTSTFLFMNSSGQVGIGTTPSDTLNVRADQNASTRINLDNENTSSGANSYFIAQVGASTSGDAATIYNVGGPTASFITGIDNSDGQKLKFSSSTSGAAVLGTNDIMAMSTTKSVYIGDGSGVLAQGATAGFIYIRGISGAPSGTPGSYTGSYPLTFDPAANKLWMYNGTAWKGTVLS